MNNNFEKWFFTQKQNISNNSYELEIEDFSRAAWDACKKEVLEILQNERLYWISDDTGEIYFYQDKLIKEVEKL